MDRTWKNLRDAADESRDLFRERQRVEIPFSTKNPTLQGAVFFLTHISEMADRLIRLLLQLGVVLAVVVALPYKLFELDRYFVPKELVLHVVALAIALALLSRRESASFDLADGLIAFFLLWSAASALFATNYWVAQRALGVSISSAIVFWGARSLGDRGGLYRPVLIAAATAAVIAALLSLAQAYGLETEYFSTN